MPNKILSIEETDIVFAASGGDAVFTLTSVGAGAGRIGAQFDRGASARAALYEWHARVNFVATVTIGDVFRFWFATALPDGTDVDGDLGTSDAAISAEDSLRNLSVFLGVIEADAADTTAMKGSGRIWLPSRRISPVGWNATAVALSATAADHRLTLTPVPPEIA